jgi:hypothetical protein
MKFNLIVAIAVLLSVGTVTAQNVNIGIKGGVNLYTLGGDNDEGFETKAGYHIGLLGHIHMGPHFALQPEVVFSAQGAKSESNEDVHLDLNYVNVPLMFQYMFNNGFRLQAGPQLGFLVSADLEGDDVKDDLNGVDFGIGLGTSYISPSGFGVDARYNHGLTNINENDGFDSFNRGFQLGVFYQFKHKS